MHAIRYHRHGGPEVLRLEEVPDPVPGPGEVRVRLQAAGVAPIDWKLRAGRLQAHFALTFPKIPGRDGTGIVDQVGPGVTAFAAGDPVCAIATPTGPGTHAQAIVCPVPHVVRRPDGLDPIAAGGLLQAGVSAWISAVATAAIGPGMRVLVHAGAGTVGGLIVQMAHHLGADVSATCRDGNQDYVRSLGADRAIAYDREDFGALRGQDVVFDLLGGSVHARSYPVLRRGGHLVYLIADPVVEQGEAFGVRVTRPAITEAPDALSAVMDLAGRGVIRAQVADVLPLAEDAAAQERLEAGQVTRGRLVLQM